MSTTSKQESKSMLEDMVKKAVMELMNKQDSDSVSSNKTDSSNKKELKKKKKKKKKKKTRGRSSHRSTSSSRNKEEEEDEDVSEDDSMKAMFEDMVKKVVMDMVKDKNNRTISREKGFRSIKADGRRATRSSSCPKRPSSDKGFTSIKADGRRVTRSSPRSPKRRGSSRSDSASSSRSKFRYKDFSKMSLHPEDNLGREEWDKLTTDDDESSSTVKKDRKKKSDGKKKKKKKKNKIKSRSVSPGSSRSSKTSRKSAMNSRMREVLNDMNGLGEDEKIPSAIMDDTDDSMDNDCSVTSEMTGVSVASRPGSVLFIQEMTSKLSPHLNSLCIQDAGLNTSNGNGRPLGAVSQVNDFEAAFKPNDMRCLALVSHNEMKATMKDFVIKYKNVLKKFRLTGTQSTMKMLGEVFAGDNSVVFGPACNSGPLGGDAELVAMMATGQLGGILFFQDPMTAHPHQVDIECLVRQALVHNTVMATTPTTAMTILEVFKMALMGEGRPELIPSFFFTLQSPTVEAYKNNQKKAIASHAKLSPLPL